MQYCYLNGHILPEDEARVGILDIGLLRGFGIYEAMAMINGKIFRWEDHITRFKKSAEFLNITVPLGSDEIKKTIFELIEKNAFSSNTVKRVNIKCILTGGKAIGGIDFDSTTPTFYIFLEEWKALDSKYYSDGAGVIMYEHLRQYPQYKTINYLTATHLQNDMKNAGALEILYTWENNVLECATSNFFIVTNGVLVTTKDNILAGVTRNVIIELARKDGFRVDERTYSLDELFSANECFLTSSFKDVVPVIKVGNTTIAKGLVGETTQKISQLFGDFLLAY